MKFLSNLRNKIFQFAESEEGASAIEYAVLAAIIVAALYATFDDAFSGAISTAFAKITTALT